MGLRSEDFVEIIEETAEELRGEWLEGVETVGITAGASTPPEAIEAVRRRLDELAAEHG